VKVPHFWKDADPDIPILKKAKAEYAKSPNIDIPDRTP
jgi:hypothetical protein